MLRNEFVLCGHGSGTPTEKNMEQYCGNRHRLKASNGKDKGLVCVVRFLETEEQQQKFHNLYFSLLGRNIYSQEWRNYVYTMRNGKYYSDCSSSGCHTYAKCGVNGVRDYNTAAMYYNGKKVDVRIVDGQIAEEDLPKIRVGDALLFRGNDPSRPEQIGHVEYIYRLPEEKEKWVQISNGEWTYKKPDGKLAKNEWLRINSHWYFFNDSCEAVKGYQVINEERYYFETSGDYECALMHTNDRGALVLWEV